MTYLDSHAGQQTRQRNGESGVQDHETINIVSQPEHPFKPASARWAWWERIQKFNGKILEAFVKDVTKNPPSLQPNGQYGKAGKVEPPSGWISYFVRTKLVEVVEQAEQPTRKRAASRKKNAA